MSNDLPQEYNFVAVLIQIELNAMLLLNEFHPDSTPASKELQQRIPSIKH